jgi:flotillin
MFILATVVLAGLAMFLAMVWRVVVSTDHIHVVQSRKHSTPYGRGMEAGNVYYKIPSSIPFFGVKVMELPTAIFSVAVNKYDAYDSARVPFLVDVIAFFQVDDAVEASRRVSNAQELINQLQNTMRGAVRRILASFPINDIMGSRSTLNETFFKEVSEQTKNWGIKVNQIEFMNIEDFPGTKVITNIMDKERTSIEKESRVQVAENMKVAQLAEIEAAETTALRAVAKEQRVGIETEKASQVVKEQQAETKRKEMNVLEIDTVRRQEIMKTQTVIAAEAEATSQVMTAEGYKKSKVLEGEGLALHNEVIGTAEAVVIKNKGLAEAEATQKRAEALKNLNEAGITVETLNANVRINEAKWKALGDALSHADLKLVQSGAGANLFGIDLNAETGADLAMFIDQLPKETKDKIEGAVGPISDLVKKALKK